MFGLTNRPGYIRIARPFWPAFTVLAANLALSSLIDSFTFVGGSEALWKVPVRYLRFSLTLALPLFLMLPLSSFMSRVFTIGRRELIAAAERETGISPLKTWIIRPFQGIGLSFLIGAKLLAMLQDYSVVAAGSARVLPPGQFAPGRMAMSAAVAAVASLCLSFLWTLDDLGAHQRNTKTGEMKMAGRYLGVLLPVIFGFTGFLNLLQDIPASLAIRYVFQITVALYPPFATLAVCHSLYVTKKGDVILARLAVRPMPALRPAAEEKGAVRGNRTPFPGQEV